MPKPVIGIIAYRSPSQWGYGYISIAEAYVRAVSQAGAVPLLIPLGLSDTDLDQLGQRLDGILFTGGGDLDPALYQGEAHPAISRVDPDRDRIELHLVGISLQSQIPFLAICRGLQVVNVALGGDLYGDISTQAPGAQKHDFLSSQGFARTRLSHPVRIQPGTTTGRILGKANLQVNSMHHQAIRRLAVELVPTAYAPDGVLEGAELPGHPFGIGVQWHPEWLTDQVPIRALFAGLAAAAQRRASLSTARLSR